MTAREECGLEEALSKADQVTGISFKTNFSFAVAGHLLKVRIWRFYFLAIPIKENLTIPKGSAKACHQNRYSASALYLR